MNYNIKIICLLGFAFLIFIFQSTAQSVKVLKSPHIYCKEVVKDPLKIMVEITSIAPGIQYQLVYGTKNNFTKKVLYEAPLLAFARKAVVLSLKNVQDELNIKGLGLKIFDAYRPYSSTVKMWNIIQDERYVANPAKGSGHNRGLSIDLTIINLKTGKELNMGTGFDNFTDTAHHSFTSLPSDVLQNRQLLKSIMERNGFKSLETEWWHYSWPNDRNYEVLDIKFKKLRKVCSR